VAKKQDKRADRVRRLFDAINDSHRQNWETVNQEGHDFYLDNQISEQDVDTLREQGMPTFTVNRIIPVVEMLNYYATNNTPRWQAVGVEASDSDVAAVFSDVADYIWNNSEGQTLYSNVINDAITKSIGYLQVAIDPNADNGMGEVILQQPDPFDVYIDPKSRDPLFRDASHVIIRKVLPKAQLVQMYPEFKSKIQKSSSRHATDYDYSDKPLNSADFQYKEITTGYDSEGASSELVEYFEVYEKENKKFCNVFYQKIPSEEELAQVKKQVDTQIAEMTAEMEVQLQELQNELQQGVQSGEILPDRMELELQKRVKENEAQLALASQQLMAQAQKEMSVIENRVITAEEYKVLKEDKEFAPMIVDHVFFYKSQIKLLKVAGNITLSEDILPVENYPLVPFMYKWTGTPFSMSAVAPLVGKQQEINKAHQLMIHNASLGSSLRWMYQEGSIDTAYWEKFATAPGALLPVNQGFESPKEVMPAQLSGAFYQIVQNGKADMEYLAGIYGTSMGSPDKDVETYRGLLALDEYGTRRVKQWLKSSIEPSLKQLGEIVKDFSQGVYKAHKVMRIVQPNNIEKMKEVEINVPIYNDYGDAIGKWNDYSTAKFDVRIVAGSTLPVNRWAYLAELKELLKLGIVDDIAVLAETDIRNKEKIVQRKSLYSQLQSQLEQLQEQVKDREGTIETLSRQLVQAGIKEKVTQGEKQVAKAVMDRQLSEGRSADRTKAESDLQRQMLKQNSLISNGVPNE